ncbi:hypothetical protein [Photobacterium leiognathi]|uniref:hypothetical protein n=1 Tax=Photobacterium leiognathi TaxID=553611 RepID=UPI002980D91F|nr:hypothetical protein [Photobacterium leiognathi]
MKMNKLALVVLAALPLIGCGGGSDDNPVTPPPVVDPEVTPPVVDPEVTPPVVDPEVTPPPVVDPEQPEPETFKINFSQAQALINSKSRGTTLPMCEANSAYLNVELDGEENITACSPILIGDEIINPQVKAIRYINGYYTMLVVSDSKDDTGNPDAKAYNIFSLLVTEDGKHVIKLSQDYMVSSDDHTLEQFLVYSKSNFHSTSDNFLAPKGRYNMTDKLVYAHEVKKNSAEYKSQADIVIYRFNNDLTFTKQVISDKNVTGLRSLMLSDKLIFAQVDEKVLDNVWRGFTLNGDRTKADFFKKSMVGFSNEGDIVTSYFLKDPTDPTHMMSDLIFALTNEFGAETSIIDTVEYGYDNGYEPHVWSGEYNGNVIVEGYLVDYKNPTVAKETICGSEFSYGTHSSTNIENLKDGVVCHIPNYSDPFTLGYTYTDITDMTNIAPTKIEYANGEKMAILGTIHKYLKTQDLHTQEYRVNAATGDAIQLTEYQDIIKRY